MDNPILALMDELNAHGIVTTRPHANDFLLCVKNDYVLNLMVSHGKVRIIDLHEGPIVDLDKGGKITIFDLAEHDSIERLIQHIDILCRPQPTFTVTMQASWN